MKKVTRLTKIPVTDLINILIKYEKKRIKFVDLDCIVNDEGDQIGVLKHKKVKKVPKEVLTPDKLSELLKHI